MSRLMDSFAADFRIGVDVNLGVGYVNENTIPRDLFQRGMAAVLADPDKYRFALNYGGPRGSANLIDSIRRYYIDRRIGGMTADAMGSKRVIIGANGATSLLEGVAQLLRSPGVVVTGDPLYYIFGNTLERVGYEILACPEDAEGIDPQRMIELVEQRGVDDVRFFYIVTVNNPSCSLLANSRRRLIVDYANQLSRRLGRRIPVIFDRAYEDLIHDPQVEQMESALMADELGIVYEIGTLSKVLAPALRIGYLIGPAGGLIDALIQKTSDAGFSAPLINQEIASYLLDNHIDQQLADVNAGYRQKSQQVRQWLTEELGDEIAEIRGGSASFYFYLTFRSVATDESSPFFQFATRTTGLAEIDGPPDDRRVRVLYIPGEHCVHPAGELVELGRRQMRLSYGFEELPQIERAIPILREALGWARRSR
ncbi:MAG: aminotransferase class I/II-fold pyridoxal phosphate-dependent enzyme [Pirellulaceae bacterium]|nr:aminotransferase class I/II-fold pyridoxal phosphate-dependent enzyme [Pirellulaceae bacterium]